jgi:hypothetical protein
MDGAAEGTAVVCCCRIAGLFSYPYVTLKIPMRQLLSLLLSCGAAILLLGSPATAAEPALEAAADKQVQLAQMELARVRELVEMGALPRARIEEAEAKIEDAKDEAILAKDMYGDLPGKSASQAEADEMVAAAQRRLDRQQARVAEAQKMVDSGIAAKSYLEPLQLELNARQTALNLAHTRAELMADLAARAQTPAPPQIAVPALDASALALDGEEHYEGDGEFNEARDLPPLELAFSEHFDRALPISAEGETEVHREMGFDHRGRVDVAVVPTAPEGIWLREYLQARKIPYYAFSRAIPGKATAAHIHIGPGSTRLVTPQLSKRLPAHAVHSAD